MTWPEHSSVARRDFIARVIFVLALAAMVGDTLGLTWLKGLGIATGFAPLPKVFSDVDGHETFAARFTILETSPDGSTARRVITPEMYGNLRGPYNRRNVYGAALSYAPRLPEEVWRPVFCHGLSPGGPLRSELRLSPEGPIAVEIATLTRGRSNRFLMEDPCTH